MSESKIYFDDPHDNLSEGGDDPNDIADEVGYASPDELRNAPSRRWMLYIGGAVVVVAGSVMFVLRGTGEATPGSSTGPSDVSVAEMPAAAESESLIDATDAAQQRQFGETSDAGQARNVDVANPLEFRINDVDLYEAASFEEPASAQDSAVPSPGAGAPPVAETASGSAVRAEPAGVTYPVAGQTPGLAYQSAPADDPEAQRKARLRARLDGSEGTLIASSGAIASSPVDEAMASIADMQQRTFDQFAPGGQTSPSSASEIAAPPVRPGSRVTASLSTRLITYPGSQSVVEARISSALRDGTRIVLPAGTRAYGMATSSGGEVGADARYEISFNTFVLPDGRVIREGLVGTAADPTTLAMSVPAKADRKLLSRTLRLGAATAVDLALAGDDRNQSIYSRPSQRDLAVQDARERVSNMLGAQATGDEQSDRTSIILDQGTSILIIFGLPTGNGRD